jgi:catechol 2,3-dioxygenase-like lactoylglutathione lyase family enzyme
MPFFDHLGISTADLPRGIRQWHPILAALGFERSDAENSVAWYREGDPEFIIYGAREPDSGPHHHGRVGWQHLALTLESRAEVDRLHGIAREAGWTVVREPKEYPRFSHHYYASFVEDADGIRLEFMNQRFD